ncbi:hypothetical protein SVI_2225 [Shewanella violacea DSS12]|uniref:DDH domain-containing protein n=1 Tax=Shewanella violacea (strain JCM 10179 / CIP 106290 / LMG 19151 / DSS12) TaxID=637905 RepID=D4ZKJ7_SHEVD|nr:hypothetical protein SVI_2225 [Shewanella violacea DSS12]
MSVYVVGHKIPDSDSICGAIALANLKNAIDEPAIAARLGELSPETAFILESLVSRPLNSRLATPVKRYLSSIILS